MFDTVTGLDRFQVGSVGCSGRKFGAWGKELGGDLWLLDGRRSTAYGDGIIRAGPCMTQGGGSTGARRVGELACDS